MSTGGADVKFHVLGAVEFWHEDRAVDIGHAKQRCVLAILLLAAGQPVSTRTLIDRVWGHNPPDGALNVLYAYIARLRKAMRPAGVRLISRSGGYLIDIPPTAVDVHRFRERADVGRATDDPEKAAAAFDEAVGLWRGAALAGLSGAWAEETAGALTAEYLNVIADRNEAYLLLGRHAELLDRLRDVVAANPGDERLVGQLMLALYRCGLATEARDQYAVIRQHLIDEHGSAPGPRLRELHQHILRDDPALLDTSPQQAPTWPVPAGLPPDVSGFVARHAELSILDSLLAAVHRTVVVAAVQGTAGVGKTTLAVHWAHRVRSRFRDGMLYANLNGHGPGSPKEPAEVLDGFLSTLDVAPLRIPADIEAKAALYRSLLHERDMLVLLDNVARPEQVRPLLPGTPGCMVLVTSRNELTGLVATNNARPVTLDRLTAGEARALLSDRLGTQRLDGEPDAVAEIIALSAGLPLALVIVAARVASRPRMSLHVMVSELRDVRSRLDALDAGEEATQVRAVLSWSYRGLGAEAARLFRLLGLYPGPSISRAALADLANTDWDRLAPAVADLMRAHLLEEHTTGRYATHDLLRTYAAELVRTEETADEQDAALDRLLDHYLHASYAAALLLDPHREPIELDTADGNERPEDHEQALAWFGAEQAVLVAAVEQAARLGRHQHTWRLAWSMADYLDWHSLWHDYVSTLQAAVDAVHHTPDLAAQALCHRMLGHAYARNNRFDDAHAHYRDALDLHSRAGDHVGQGHTHINIAMLVERQGDTAAALRHAEVALGFYRTADHRRGQAVALNAVGWNHAQLGDHHKAISACEQALTIHQALGNRLGLIEALDSLGYAHLHLGDFAKAVDHYDLALAVCREIGDRFHEATVLTSIGDVHRAAASKTLAREAYDRALVIFDDLGSPEAERVRDLLRQLGP